MAVLDVLRVALARGADAERLTLRARTTGPHGAFPITGYTLGDLDRAVDARAEILARDGAREGWVYPVVVAPDEEGVLTLLALWRLGCTPAPLNPGLTDRERRDASAALLGHEMVGDTQVVLWTSGTSGRPRGVALSPEAMTVHVEAASRRLALDPERDVWLASLSLAHVGGLIAMVRALLTGSRLVALGAVGPEEMATLLDHGQMPVSHLSLVPTQFLRLLDATADAPPPATFRCLLLGGAHTPTGLLARAHAAGWPVALTYGMTEMWSQVATATPEHGRQKPGTVGEPLAGVEVTVADSGEILVKGPTMATRYLDETPLVDSDGWYHTGDLGRVDDEGDLWITGRRSDRIVSGGVNVDATEVEEALRGHPAVADVCVAGIPDHEWGELVVAWVVPVAGEFDIDEVDAWIRTRLSGPKRPRRWVVESKMPLNAAGKVDRALIRDLLSG